MGAPRIAESGRRRGSAGPAADTTGPDTAPRAVTSRRASWHPGGCTTGAVLPPWPPRGAGRRSARTRALPASSGRVQPATRTRRQSRSVRSIRTACGGGIAVIVRAQSRARHACRHDTCPAASTTVSAGRPPAVADPIPPGPQQEARCRCSADCRAGRAGRAATAIARGQPDRAASSGPPRPSPRTRRNGLTGSMGRVRACADNAAMESFFSLLQKNVLDRHRWATRQELRLAIATWIESTKHCRRRQRRLGRLTPIEYETINRAATAA